MFLAVIAAEPSTVVALVANGEAPEPLPHTLPAQIRCFDRWGNPTDTPHTIPPGHYVPGGNR